MSLILLLLLLGLNKSLITPVTTFSLAQITTTTTVSMLFFELVDPFTFSDVRIIVHHSRRRSD